MRSVLRNIAVRFSNHSEYDFDFALLYQIPFNKNKCVLTYAHFKIIKLNDYYVQITKSFQYTFNRV